MYVIRDIWGNKIQPKEIKLFLFADERKRVKVRGRDERWDYLCLLVIPSNKIDAAIEILKHHRGEVEYFEELRFREINKKAKGKKFELAKRWLEEIIEDGKQGRGIFYFSILGIDKNKLDFSCFGEGDSPKGKYANVYNRFFRTNFLSTIKSFFDEYDSIIVERIFHDREGNLEQHEYFNWHLIWKVEREEERIFFASDKIIFVESDHRKEKNFPWASHFIQLADILVGSVSYCMELSNPRHKGQKELAKVMLPLVEKLVYRADNKNSRFGYFKKYKLAFFPKTEKREELPNQVYTKRDLALLDEVSKQLKLPLVIQES